MTVDQETLRRIEKALQGRASVSDARSPWHELLKRTPVTFIDQSFAASLVAGHSGSWAASFSQDTALKDPQGAFGPSPVLASVSKLGQPGLPEINYVPFSHRTNRFGPKGPSLLGHPISFSIVGPTLKSPLLDCQWTVTDKSGAPGQGDILTLDTMSVLSPTGGPATDPTAETIEEVFGFTDLTGFPGGLYLTISQTGFQGLVEGSQGGIGDGFVFSMGGATRNPLVPLTETSKFEIFRVVAMGSGSLVLDATKRIADYFTIPANAALRAVTLMEPHVSRLATVPGSGAGVGREMVFIVVPPETAANTDLMPPYDGQTPGDGTWLQGGFDPLNTSASVGLAGTYTGKVPLPVPLPISSKSGRAQATDTAPALVHDGAGLFRIIVDTADVDVEDISKIIHVHTLNPTGTSTLIQQPSGGFASEESFLGWFEIVDVDAIDDYYTLKRLPEVDPNTGKVFYGISEALVLDNFLSPADDLRLKFTVHNRVQAYHEALHFDLDQTEALRLTGLIDPAWVQRSAKTSLKGSSPARADKAIFDTSSSGAGAISSNANPGSLLDLGFRMVLYPAREVSPGVIGPDWDNPVDGAGDVTLDPSVNEAQSIQVDYASGLVYLSHAPVPGAGCDIAPNGVIAGVANPRNEVVLYAACVPFSMEEGQRSGGSRVLGGSDLDVDVNGDVAGLGDTSRDVYGARIIVPVMGQVEGVAQTFTCGTTKVLDLAIGVDEDTLPPTGFVELLLGDLGDQGGAVFGTASGERASTFGYTRKATITDGVSGVEHVRLLGVYGGGKAGFADTCTQDGDWVAVLRRDVQTPNTSDGTAGVPYQFDTTYGSAYRAPSVRIADGQFTPEMGGSASVRLKRLDEHERLFGDLLSSWLISGGEITGSVGLSITTDLSVALIQGRRVVVQPYRLAKLTDATSTYIYLDGTTNPLYPRPKGTASLPLPGVDDILLGKVVTAGGIVLAVVDLRNPLTNMDRRLDILVGTHTGHPQPATHFDTLAGAIKYVGEIMDPTNGDDGSYLRIKVIGVTNEQDSDLPIQLPCNGVIVEGVGMPISGGQNHGIRFQAESSFLIDTNGKADWSFRDLRFEYVDVGQAPEVNPNLRTFFSGFGQPANHLRIENCRFEGNDLAHGIYYASSAGGGLQDAHFARCVIEGVSDFVLYIADGCWAQDIRIYDCKMATGASPETTLADPAAIRFPHDLAIQPFSTRNHVRENYITGFVEGILNKGQRGKVLFNHLYGTEERAIVALSGTAGRDGHHVIEGNILENIHIAAPAVNRSGIHVLAPDTQVIRNQVELGTQINGDACIRIEDAPRCLIADNIAKDGDIVLTDVGVGQSTLKDNRTNANGGLFVSAPNCVIEGNHVLGTEKSSGTPGATGLTTQGSFHLVQNNNIISGIFISEGDVGEDCLVSNNLVGAGGAKGIKVLKNGHVISNNRCVGGGITAGGTDGPLVIKGNYLETAMTLATATGSNVIIEGNTVFGASADIICPCANSIIRNNIVGRDINGTGAINLLVSGNIVTRYIVLDTAGYIVSGNRASEVRETTGASNTDPDAFGVVTSNRLDANGVFGAALAGSAKDNNTQL